MNHRRHRVSAELFAAIADGGGGSTAVRWLASVDYSKRMLLLRGVVSLSRQARHPQHDLVCRAYDLLADVQEHEPDAVDAVLRYPSCGAWAGRTVLALGSGQAETGTGPAGLATLAAAAAIRARFPCTIEVPVTNGVITLPSLGQVLAPELSGHGSTAQVRSRAAGAEIMTGNRCVLIPADPHLDTPGWRGLRQITARSGGETIRLLIDDLDPYRLPAPALRARLAPDEVSSWESGLSGAWDVLVRNHRTIAEEVLTAIRVLTPLTAPTTGQVSATSRETFGCIGLSSAVDPLALAVILAHEVQHAKLYAFAELKELVHPHDGELYYAPWRDDMRPASGLLQGTYAYLGVTGFWRRQRQRENGDNAIRAHTEFARWRAAVRLAAETLMNSGCLTQTGEKFVTRMIRIVGMWCEEHVPAAAEAAARDAAERHAKRTNRGT